MTSFYNDLSEIMNECIDTFDCRTTPVQLIRKGAKTRNPVTLDYEIGSETAIDVTCFTIPLNKPLIDGVAIVEGDVGLVLKSDVAPEKDDNVLIDGSNYSIVAIETMNAGGVLLGYKLQVRR